MVARLLELPLYIPLALAFDLAFDLACWWLAVYAIDLAWSVVEAWLREKGRI